MQRTTMRFGFILRVLCAGLVCSLSCGGGASVPPTAPESSAANASPSASDPSAASDASPAAQPAAATAAPTAPAQDAASAPSAEEAKKAPAEPTLVELCEQGCKKVKARCSESAFDTCRMNCVQYQHPPAGCEAEARTALECSRDAEDIPCVNIAPEICSHKFRRVVACANGKPLPDKDDGPRKLEDWERFSAPSAGFSVMAPKGMAASNEGGEAHFAIQQGDVTYSVRVLPAPKEKPTQKNLVKVAMDVLGKCTQRLKLHGMVDRPEKVFIRFESHCPDGVDYRGAFLVTHSKLYIPYVALAKGSKTKPETDAFIFGLELNK
jgi:hypothetical protein